MEKVFFNNTQPYILPEETPVKNENTVCVKAKACSVFSLKARR